MKKSKAQMTKQPLLKIHGGKKKWTGSRAKSYRKLHWGKDHTKRTKKAQTPRKKSGLGHKIAESIRAELQHHRANGGDTTQESHHGQAHGGRAKEDYVNLITEHRIRAAGTMAEKATLTREYMRLRKAETPAY